KFGDAIFFSHVPVDGEFRTEKIAKLDMASYQAFRLKPPPVIKTPFVLFVEWDGYVIEPRAWHPSFREYDYIGAKWIDNAADGMNVGNSGFCLQSKRLLDRLADPRFVPTMERVTRRARGSTLCAVGKSKRRPAYLPDLPPDPRKGVRYPLCTGV